MARRLRLHVPGGFYHVTLRGNHRNAIFFRDSDRELLNGLVADALERLAARLHAYCWMTNHLHMLLQVSDVPLGRIVLRIASAYARNVQARLETTGHLFERRYHAVLVDADRYLLTLVRYIHLNPVRARLVTDPVCYPWCSHGVYLGISKQPWVTTGFALRLLSADYKKAILAYRKLVADSESLRWGDGPLVTNARQPQILGDDAFVSRVTSTQSGLRRQQSLTDLLKDCSNRFRVTPESLISPVHNRTLTTARAWIGRNAVEHGIASICEVARFLGRTEGAIRQAMRRYPTDIPLGRAE